MSPEALLNKQPILLFDGECGFCNHSVKFFLKHERKTNGKGVMHFAPLNASAGEQLRNYFEVDKKIDSIILIRSHSAYIKSCAALRMTLYMKGLWPLLSVFLIIPPFLRNPIYDWVARNRMKFFGRVQNCELLQAEEQARFL